MKPCWRYRKGITALALGELGTDEAHALERHFESCGACRRGFEELAGIRDELATSARSTEVSPSAGFHRRLMRALRKEPAPSSFRFWSSQLQPTALALSFGLLLAGSILFWAVRERSSDPGRSTALNRGQTASAHIRAPEPALPTIANYREAAERSLESLDDLLTQQALRCSPATPLYTAATLAWLNPPVQSGASEGAAER